jgi:hypothetical protein
LLCAVLLALGTQAAGLTISAKVLRIAEVVRGVGRTGMEEVGHIRYAAP